MVTEDKTVFEKLRLIEPLEEPDKQALYRRLTKKKVKDFFQKNVATL